MEIVIPVAAIVTLLGSYLALLHNDLTGRLQYLRALTADIRSLRSRKHGVRRAASGSVRAASWHEQHVAKWGSRRGGSGGRAIKVGDIGNNWPNTAAVGVATDALARNVASHDQVSVAQQTLHAAAAEYNRRLREFPAVLFAKSLGFRPWSFSRKPRP